MEVNKVTSHSWIAMKNHFHSAMIKDIHKYNIPKLKLRRLQVHMNQINKALEDTEQNEFKSCTKNSSGKNDSQTASKLKRKLSDETAVQFVSNSKIPKAPVSTMCSINSELTQETIGEEISPDLFEETIDSSFGDSINSNQIVSETDLRCLESDNPDLKIPLSSRLLTANKTSKSIKNSLIVSTSTRKNTENETSLTPSSSDAEDFLEPSVPSSSLPNLKFQPKSLKLYNADQCTLSFDNTQDIINEKPQNIISNKVTKVGEAKSQTNTTRNLSSESPVSPSQRESLSVELDQENEHSVPSTPDIIDNFDAALLSNLSGNATVFVKDMMQEEQHDNLPKDLAVDSPDEIENVTVTHDEKDETPRVPEREVIRKEISGRLDTIIEGGGSEDELSCQSDHSSGSVSATSSRPKRKMINSSDDEDNEERMEFICSQKISEDAGKITEDNCSTFLTEAAAVVQKLENLVSKTNEGSSTQKRSFETSIDDIKHRLYGMLLAKQIEKIMQKPKLSIADQALMVKYLAHMEGTSAEVILKKIGTTD